MRVDPREGAAAPSGRSEPLHGTSAGDERPSAAVPQRRLDSRVLFAQGHDEVEIAHGEAVYRLRRTSLGKLILTK
jgi:hemin uptake protein HemP